MLIFLKLGYFLKHFPLQTRIDEIFFQMYLRRIFNYLYCRTLPFYIVLRDQIGCHPCILERICICLCILTWHLYPPCGQVCLPILRCTHLCPYLVLGQSTPPRDYCEVCVSVNMGFSLFLLTLPTHTLKLFILSSGSLQNSTVGTRLSIGFNK